MKAQIALLMPYRISDVKTLLTKDDVLDWQAYTAFNKEAYDMFKEIQENLLESVNYQSVKRVYISLN